jgi:hypothetical protein
LEESGAPTVKVEEYLKLEVAGFPETLNFFLENMVLSV